MKVLKYRGERMNIPINDLIKYYANVSIQYTDLFVTSLDPFTKDCNRFTAAHYNGFVLTLSGSANFCLDGECYELNKGIALHAGPKMKIDIHVTSTEPWHYIVLHYEASEMASSYKNTHFSIDTGKRHRIDYLVQQLIEADKVPGDLYKLKCKSIFLHLVEILLISAKMKTASNVVDHAVNYMTENYAESITIAEIADEVGCDRRRLAYMFDKQVGMSPIQFLTEIRLKHSIEILRTTKMPIKEIAERVGYQDSFYFCRVFKKQYEMTPTEYRKQYLED